MRPAKIDNEAVNILMAGVDRGNGDSVGKFIDAGWKPGVFRSDTIMMLHVTADRDHAYLVSIPRDAYVRIYNAKGTFEEKNKVNVALSVYGPGAYVSTVEHLTGLRMDHQVIVDWAGFKDIADALGGVEVYIPESFYDTSQKIQWTAGRQTLMGDKALAYVRTRYNLPDESGDFGRIARQQNFLRSMMGKMLSRGTMANPVKLTNTLKAVVKYITVDDGFSTGEIRNLALSLRGIETDDVTFVTAPWSGYGDEVGSTVHLNMKQCDALWKAMADDDIAEYIQKYGNQSGVLDDPKGVS
jgi:LCP family protein required for cell wall assembly